MDPPIAGNAEAPQRSALRGLRRHLGWILAAKLALIALLYAFFFGPSSRPDIDAGAAGQRMHIPSR
ncbi:MAG: hypothetical protein QM719_09705 [Thermomonas sp.]